MIDKGGCAVQVVVILTTGCYLREEHRDTAASANELANEIIVGRQWKATRDSEWVDPYATPDIKQFGDSAEEGGAFSLPEGMDFRAPQAFLIRSCVRV